MRLLFGLASVLCLVAITSVDAQLDLPRVGSEIDTNEQHYFLLFPNIINFRSARLTRADGDRYQFEITDASGGTSTMPLEREAFADLRTYLTDYERIVSVESDTVWSDRPLRWDLLGGVVAPYPWLRPGQRVQVLRRDADVEEGDATWARGVHVVTVTMKDGSIVEGQILAVVDSFLILLDQQRVFDPGDRSATIWRIPVVKLRYKSSIDEVWSVDSRLGPAIYGSLGLGVGTGLSTMLRDRSALDNLPVGYFTGMLAYSLASQLSHLHVTTYSGEYEDFRRLCELLRSRASFQSALPPELLDTGQTKLLTGPGPVHWSQEKESFHLIPGIGLNLAASRLLGIAGASENEHRYIDLAPFNSEGLRGATHVAAPAWNFSLEIASPVKLGFDYAISASLPDVSGSFGDAAEYHAFGFYACPTFNLTDWNQPFQLRLQVLGGISYGTTHVLGWLNDRALSNDPAVQEETRTVYDLSESGVRGMGGVRMVLGHLNEQVSSHLQLLYRPYPTVTTPGAIDSTSFGSRLSPHTIDVGGWFISAGINFHL